MVARGLADRFIYHVINRGNGKQESNYSGVRSQEPPVCVQRTGRESRIEEV
jgi:hypothetical protein